jgi:hypothetical protein
MPLRYKTSMIGWLLQQAGLCIRVSTRTASARTMACLPCCSSVQVRPQPPVRGLLWSICTGMHWGGPIRLFGSEGGVRVLG